MKILENTWERCIRNINDFYCPYMPITMTDLVTLEDFATRRGWATMYGKTMIQPKYYLRGRITGGLMQ